MRDTTDPSPPNKMLRRSDSPENKYGDNTGHSKAKSVHTHRVRERDGGELSLINLYLSNYCFLLKLNSCHSGEGSIALSDVLWCLEDYSETKSHVCLEVGIVTPVSCLIFTGMIALV